MVKHALAPPCAIALALSVAGCASGVSTSGFTGASHGVAQAIANLQSDTTAGNEQSVCQDDLSSALVRRLQASGQACKQVIKNQLQETDSYELTVESIAIKGSTATARVKSLYSGKSHLSTLSLVQEGKRWKISGLS